MEITMKPNIPSTSYKIGKINEGVPEHGTEVGPAVYEFLISVANRVQLVSHLKVLCQLGTQGPRFYSKDLWIGSDLLSP